MQTRHRKRSVGTPPPRQSPLLAGGAPGEVAEQKKRELELMGEELKRMCEQMDQDKSGEEAVRSLLRSGHGPGSTARPQGWP